MSLSSEVGVLAAVRPRIARAVASLAACTLLLATLGCGGHKEKPAPTLLDLSIVATKDLNASAAGQGQPLVLNLYQLAAATRFQQADFFALQRDPDGTLGKDLVASGEYVIKPGESRKVSLTAASGAHFIGLVAAFQDIDQAEWQALDPISAGTTNRVRIGLGRTSVKLD